MSSSSSIFRVGRKKITAVDCEDDDLKDLSDLIDLEEDMANYHNKILANIYKTVSIDGLFSKKVSCEHDFIDYREFKQYVTNIIARCSEKKQKIQISYSSLSPLKDQLDLHGAVDIIDLVIEDELSEFHNLRTIHDFVTDRKDELKEVIDHCFDMVDTYNRYIDLKKEFDKVAVIEEVNTQQTRFKI